MAKTSQLSPLIVTSIDKYNKLAPGLAKDDKEDLAWPGVWSKYRMVKTSQLSPLMVISLIHICTG